MSLNSHSHKYKYKKTAKLLKEVEPFWKRYLKLLDRFDYELDIINESMQKEIKIPGIQIIESNYGRGIGNRDRTMELIQEFEFKDGKICK